MNKLINTELSEDQIQASMVEWFNNTFCLKFHTPRSIIFSVPNGGIRHKIVAIILKATGLLSGVSDLIIIHLGIIYFVEVKKPGEKQSPSQKEFQARVESHGFKYLFFDKLEDFQNYFTKTV